MRYIKVEIDGVPYCKNKKRGNKAAALKWSQTVIKQTINLPSIDNACLLRVTFRLPFDKFPKDCPYGADIDNLLKRLMDALGETVFKNADGKDSCVVAIEAKKIFVRNKPGVDLEISPAKFSLPMRA